MNFGLDLGYGAIKLVGEYGGIELPSHIATSSGPVAADLAGIEATERPLLIKTIPHQPYWCGLGAHAYGRAIENMDYDRLIGSVEVQVLLYAAFTRYMHQCHIIPKTASVTLYVGLPLEPISGDKGEVDNVVAAVRQWLVGVHHWQADAQPYSLSVKAVHVASQPMGAYFDYILADDGRPRHAAHLGQEVGVISVGFNTVERQVFQSGTFIPRFTAGSQDGVRRLLERVNGRSQGLYSLGELDAKLRLGNLETHQDIEDWARQVLGKVEASWGRDWRRFAHVILVGGGARLLNGRLLSKFEGKASLPDDPVMAIAQGLYKLAVAKEAK
ncbi:MAG: ParM/StbA family protein [Ardenticatenaceae bacterium]|nr:ParM/StbA family protein [Ardenticatenaceae bacterium]